MKHMLTGFLAFTLFSHAETLPLIEGRLCPASAVHTYPLALRHQAERRREANGLLLQNVAILVPRPIQSGDVVIAK